MGRFKSSAPRGRRLASLRLAVAMATLAATSLVSAGGAAAEAPANNEVEVTAAALPEGFQEQVVFGGLTNPTSVEFSGDGRVFVAEKSGIVKVFDSLSDSTPEVFADLRTNVHNFWDRGLLGMALHPNFPATPYVYVLYTYDAVIGGTAPRWGVAGQTSDGCPNPPGATADGCVVSGRLSRLQAAGNQMTGPEQVLIEDWCQQYPSHSVGSLAFGADGALYVTSGDGASFNFADYGQDGSPVNPCGDPPAGVGGAQTPPTAEGGALRSQDLRTSGDPLGLDGTVLRVDPATGAGLPNNPMAGSADANARRVIATGLRNPFRMTIRPGTNEVWLGDVGWSTFEELNRVPNPTDATVENFGWPCYEGAGRQSGYDSLNLNICENLYAAGAGAHAAPYYAYNHSEKVVAGETCPMGTSSVAGVEFYEGGNYPDAYDGAIFFADYSRDCIWVMFQQGGQPAPSTRQTFFPGAANPVELKIGPSGDLFYVDFEGSVRRITFNDPTPPPPPTTDIYLSDLEWASMTNGWGPAERDTSNGEAGAGDGNTITLNGTTYAKGLGAHAVSNIRYNLGGNCFTFTADVGVDDEVGNNGSVVFGVLADGVQKYQSPVMTGASATQSVNVNVTGADELQLRVTNGGDNIDYDHADWANAFVDCTPENQNPVATIDTPLETTTWKVGDAILFSGSATDPEDGPLPASALEWTVIMHHCPSNCHEHVIQTFSGVASGSIWAPDHEYPSHLEFRLRATDSAGATHTDSVLVQPQTVTLTFASQPAGAQLTVGPTTQTAPFTRTVIVGSSNSISAPSPQTIAGAQYQFSSWSDGGAQSHQITAPTQATTYTATFTRVGDATPPTISNVRVTNINHRRATIRWTTNEPATSQVQYGRTTSYGSQTALDSTLVTSHVVRLTGLSRSTLYHYRVKSRDAAGNLRTSGDFTFRTRR